MRAPSLSVGFVLVVCSLAVLAAQTKKPDATKAVVKSTTLADAGVYYPPPGEWKREAPGAVGMDAARLDAAVAYAVANENPGPKDMVAAHYIDFGREPFDSIVGPTRPRAALNGIIIRRGSVVAEWGDTTRVDMTHSVTKTFLSTVVGLAWERGLIHNLGDRVVEYMPPPTSDLFETPHNAKVTWEHLLRQTSDWRGTLWDKPDWGDRPEGKTPADYLNVPLREPGTVFEYNDVRVNLLALAALHVWRRPLPQVLREEIMEPIGASSTWRWHGYENSWVDIDGQRMQSVSGGGHWGGGMFISARDMARFGYLFLRKGMWKGRSLVASRFIALARNPGVNAQYGFMNWYLNTNRKALPSAPESSVRFLGNGSNIIYIDWDNDLVVVVRWIRGGDALDTFLGQVIGSITSTDAAPATRPLATDFSVDFHDLLLKPARRGQHEPSSSARRGRPGVRDGHRPRAEEEARERHAEGPGRTDWTPLISQIHGVLSLRLQRNRDQTTLYAIAPFL